MGTSLEQTRRLPAESLVQNTDLVSLFRGLTEAQMLDSAWMARLVHSRIGCRLNRKELRLPASFVTTHEGLQCKQYPEELGAFLVFLYQRRFEIRRYLEIGVERGGTFFTIDSFLRAHNPAYEGSWGIDITAKILNNGFRAYHEKYPTCQFVQASSDSFSPQDADLIFIDGDHRYSAVARDFERLRPFGKFVAFHDIYCHAAPGVVRLWQELKPKCAWTEFVSKDPALPVPLGIGLIHNRNRGEAAPGAPFH